MNPGSSVWSAALNKRLNPRSHILLEPEVRYKPIMKEFTASHPGSYWLPLDGYDWNTYSKLFASGLPWPVEHDFLPLDPMFVPPEDGINTDIIFTANLSMAGSDGDRLLAQFLACCALGQWVQKFGRVRFLVWVQDALRDRYLPRGVGGRNRAAVMAETVADVQEVVVSKALRTGKGHPRSSQLDAEGNLALKKKRFKSPKGITVGPLKKQKSRVLKIQPMTITELEAALANIEGSRNSKKGRGKVKIERVEARHTKLDSLDIERMRRRLLHVVEYQDDEEVANLFEKFVETDIYITERTNLFMERITKFLEDPETDQRWLTEMENPPWWYRRNQKRLIALAGELARGPSKSFLTTKSYITPIDIETTRQIEALEGLEESEPTDPAALQRQKTFDKFQEHWVKPLESAAVRYSAEDEALVFKKGMLMWGRRKFEPVVTENSDFHPPEPLALLDFSPIVLGEFFQPEDQKLRGSNWEVYMWVLRSLFMLRAHSLNSALMSMTPGGEHLLHMVDRSAAIDGNMRVRTLDVGQLVELTKAWRKWPFQAEGEHLEPPITGRIRGVKKGEDR